MTTGGLYEPSDRVSQLRVHVELTRATRDTFDVRFQIKGGSNLEVLGARGAYRCATGPSPNDRRSVGQRVALQPGPQGFDRVHVRRVRRQERDLDVSIQAVQVLAHQTTAMRLQAIPDHQQRLLQVGLERLEEFDDLFLPD